MDFNQNRLRFVHCEHLFKTAQEVKDYVYVNRYNRPSLYSEPMIFKYGDENKPNIVLAIGSAGNGDAARDDNGDQIYGVFYIDFSQVERDIADLYKQVGDNKKEIERINGIIKNILESSGFDENGRYIPEINDLILQNATSLSEADRLLSEYVIALEKRQKLHVKETSTIKPTLEVADSGTTLSNDVKLGTKIFDKKIIDNIIVEQEDGIFTSVDLDYVEDESKLVFTINGENKKDIKLPSEYHVISGKYDTYSENIVLKLNKKIDIDGELTDLIKINVADLIDEWTVMGDDSITPIILTKEHIKSEELAHEGHHDWQDVLKADVRISKDKENILERVIASDGGKEKQSLIVRGTADNISYMDGSKKITVQEGIDSKISKTSVSPNQENTIVYRTDGLYSMIDFSYNEGTNEITFRRTNPKGEVVEKVSKLNSMSFLEEVTYDASKEEIVIVYKDANGEMKTLRIPMRVVINELDVDNSNATITLTLNKDIPGKDTLQGNVNISTQEDNILENIGHALYVKGTADNIKMIDKSLGATVEESFTNLNKSLDEKVNGETSKREEEIKRVEGLITSEKERAEGVENDLRKDLTLEVNRATSAETKLDTDIKAEQKRAEGAENNLDEAIKAEQKRAEGAENNLRKDLDDEKYRSTTKDEELSNSIKDEHDRAVKTENELSQSVATEKNRAELKEAEIDGKLSQEIQRSKATDESLDNAIKSEQRRAEGVENELRKDLDNEISRSRQEDEKINGNIADTNSNVKLIKEELEGKISSETSRAILAETKLQGNIDGEASRAKAKEDELTIALNGEITRSTNKDEELDKAIKDEVNRSTKEDSLLRENLNKAVNDLTITVGTTGTIDLVKTKSEVGSSIYGKVNVSAKDYNLINKDGEPLYASVDLLYRGDDNQLVLTRSGYPDKVIQLNEGSLIKDIDYDDRRKVLIITYEDSLGEERQVEVDVKGLFNQWDVETNHLGAVKLTKEINYDGEGRDKLTAEVVVSPDENNALKNNGGALFVSNRASDIELEDGSNLTSKIEELEKKDVQLSNDLKEEITRASEAETALGTRIDNEVTRATNIENDLRKDLDNEISRSETKDNELISKLNGEIDRSKEADIQLSKDIDSERSRATAAEIDLSERLSDEVTNRINEIDKISLKLDNEITRSIDVDNGLRTDLDEETRRSQDIDSSFQLKLEEEISRATLAETKLQGSIESEASRAKAKEDELTIALNGEITRSTNKDEELSNKIETEIKRSTDIDNAYKESLQAEITRASEAETALGTRIDNEVTRATNVETQLRKELDEEVTNSEMRYNELNSILSEEIDRSTVEDGQIRELLTAETNRATAAEIDLAERLSDEVTNRTNEVSNLTTKLDSEITRSSEKDNELRADLDTEITRSKEADKNVNIKLADEIGTRKSEISRVDGKLDNEISRSTEKDNELTNGLTNEVSRAKAEEKRIEDKFDASIGELEDADKTLTNNLNQAKTDLSFITESTSTVTMTKRVSDVGGSIINAKVNVSDAKDNLINANGEALFASVDVTYDSKSNKLILSRSGLDSKEIQLNEGSIIDTITYDEETKELVITYRNSKDETKEVRVGVSELFNDWEVEDNHLGGVILTKTPNFNGKGTDKLSAEVSISKLEGNALVNDNGNLYVSNKAKDIILDNGNKLEDEIKNLHDADKVLQDNIDAEEKRATDAEKEISDNLTKEINRATLKENSIETALTNEINRAKEAEGSNRNLITAETQERETEIVRVEGLIATEKGRAEEAENKIKELLQNEIDRAKSAESANKKAIDDEAVRATRVEDKLRNDIDSVSGDVITNKTDIEEKLSAETRRAKEAEGANKKAIDDEIVRANAAEKANADNILAETTRAKETENSLKDSINGEKNRAEGEETRIVNLLNAEITRSTNKDNDLNDLILNEIDRSTRKDDELDARIDAATNELSFRVESTPSLELTKVSGETSGYIVKGKVRVSPNESNIINNDGESLYASVDASYDASKNTLTVTRSGNPDRVIQFNNGTIVESFEFNENTNALKIVTVDANGGKHTNEVSLSSLNNNWKAVNDENSAVILTKGKDELTGESTISAKVVISEDPNSLLKNDKGVLSVTNSADKIVLTDGVTVSSAIEALKNADKQLGKDIVDETNRAKDADRDLQTAISNEKSRAEGVEKEIAANVSNNTKNLDKEIERALAAEKTLSDDLKAETTRANEADTALGDRITSEKERALGKETELAGLINSENTRAVAKETELEKAIAGVKTKAENNETQIGNISTEVDRISRDYSMTVEDTTTIDLTKETLTSGGFKVFGDVKLSNLDGNTIIKQADGIFSNVDLTYDESNNTLHFKRNDKVADIVLNTVSTIKSITYDSLTDEIVITYTGKNGDELTTRFPAKSLFKPIKANNEGKNVILEVKQVDGTDTISGNVNFVNCINNEGKNVKLTVTKDNKLAAEAVISTLENNLLHKDENGSLFASNQSKDILMCAPETYGSNVCDAIVKVDDKINDLKNKYEYDEDLYNKLVNDVNNLKFKTNIVVADTPSIDLTFSSTENSSNLRADVIPSNDPHNLVTVYNDGGSHVPDDYGHYPSDTYNGIKFDGNIDYQLFTNEDGSIKTDKIEGVDKFADWTRHLQMKRNNDLFASRAEALEFMHKPEFLADKKDGEPLVARYQNGDETSFILGFVRIGKQGEIEVQTIDNKGTTVDKMEYVPNAKDITATDEFGIQTVTHVPAESLYVEFTDTSSLKHSIVVPLKELVEEYTYPESVSTFDKKLGKSDGESVKIYHNVKFDVERHEDNKSIIKADIDFYDCGEYGGEDFIK